MYEITHLNVWISARYSAAVAVILSLLFSIIGITVILVDSWNYFSLDDFWDELFPLILVPLITALVSFFASALFFWLYNVIAERSSGLKVELEFIQEEEKNSERHK